LRLFDTTFVVDLVNSDPGAVRLAQKVDTESSLAAVSAVTVHEYLFGIHFRYGRESRDTLQEKLAAARNDLDRFEVIPFSTEVAELSATTQADLVRLGKQIGINDVYIAATGLRFGLTVVTRNKAHFERVPKLKVEGY
jgi:tRNA(fMet)-specific endonuclease VapC